MSPGPYLEKRIPNACYLYATLYKRNMALYNNCATYGCRRSLANCTFFVGSRHVGAN
jgi:hypothetical protein